jgi:alkanesulfonate monooxygenase SsuD/methylene tetrahydromethanopterin reductase-like flavin-dependent oxidoreductase (luciferase family)
LTSAVAVLSAADPVRLFQQFATLDLLSAGRAEMVVGRGSSIEAFPLFGYDLQDYDALFAEKLDLLLNVRANEHVTWSGEFRPQLTGQGVYPRPIQEPLPIWLGVGGTPQSFARAGVLGLPLMVAIIGGDPRPFRRLVDLYRAAGRRAGHAPEQLRVGVHALGYVAPTLGQAVEEFAPGYIEGLTRAGRERGWGTVTHAHFDAEVSSHGGADRRRPGRGHRQDSPLRRSPRRNHAGDVPDGPGSTSACDADAFDRNAWHTCGTSAARPVRRRCLETCTR